MFLEEKLLSFALLGAGWVLWLLVILSIICLAVSIERAVYLFRNASAAAPLHTALSSFVNSGGAEAFRTELDRIGGIQARVLAAGLEAVREAGHDAGEQAIAGHLIAEKSRLDRSLIVLGTTGSNAPFIGLFGTVLGIIKAFNDLALNEAEAASAVMAGISEALVATAIGLLVAIPAVVLYNTFQRRNKTLLSQTESYGHLVLARLRGPDRTGAGPATETS